MRSTGTVLRVVVASAALVGLAADRAFAGPFDTTFGGTGIVHDPQVNGSYRAANAMVLQPGGEIVAAGFTGPGTVPTTGTAIAVVRVLADGTFDASFGTGGIVTTPVGDRATADAVARQADGKIVVGGQSLLGGVQRWMLARYDGGGTLDPTFGTGGVAVGTGALTSVQRLAIDPLGRIVAAGFGPGAGAIARFDAAGVPDATFGSAGFVALPAGSFAWAVLRQPDGRIVAAGGIPNGSHRDVLVARVDDTGAFDASFGSGGVVTTELSTRDDDVLDVAQQPDGRLLVAGRSVGFGSTFIGARFIVRYDGAGALDASFGMGGITMSSPVAGQQFFTSLALASDGKIVAGGTRVEPFEFFTSTIVERYLADGSLDPTFAVPPDPATDPFLQELAIQPDGRIVTAGVFAPFDGVTAPAYMQVELRRYLPDGFCGDGVVQAGEECDPSGPCCFACQFAAEGVSCTSDANACTHDFCDGNGSCTHPPVADGVELPCNDANVCTGPDKCTGGTCTGPLVTPDVFCAECDPVLGTVVRPRTGCKTTVSGGASLKLRRGSTPAKDKLTWKWRKGDATTLAELGDPFAAGPATNAFHELCVFDSSGPEPALVVATAAEPESLGLCARPPCWRSRSSGFVYKSNPPNLFGLSNMTLVAGEPGRAKNSVKARGAALFTPNPDYAPDPPPWTTPLTVQLGARNGACFEATFSAAGVRANGTTAFSAKSD